MGHTLEQFAAECRQGAQDRAWSGKAARRVCAIVQNVLKDDAFIAKHVGYDVPERKILDQDPAARLQPLSLAARAPRRATRTTMSTRG